MSVTHTYNRRGITLLEVLISLGILSVGLASVVALVPAGGDQAKKAIIDDRRGALGPNALADFVNRGLLNPAKWSPAQPAATNYRLLFDPVVTGSLTVAGLVSVTGTGFTTGLLADEIFRAQDDLTYKMPDDEDAPALPTFFGGAAKRMNEGNFSWLATLVPVKNTSPFHRLSVVTVHRRGEIVSGSASFPASTSSGPFVQVTPSTAIAKEDVARFFAPGAVVLLTNSSSSHEWRTVVMASPDVSAAGTVSTIEVTLNRDAPSPLTTIYAVEGANGLYERVVRLEETSPWSP